MNRRLIALVASTFLTSGCHFQSPASTQHPGDVTHGQPDATTGTRNTLAVRLLAQGSFTLPPSLISVGSGSLVSVGSGSLVSVGSGGLVSVGSARYRLASLSEQPVAGARVSLQTSAGADTGNGVTTDGAGRYFLTGDAGDGIYRLDAQVGSQHYRTLAVVGTSPADAPIDVATTLVTARLLAQNPNGLAVLPSQAFTATAAAVRAALADTDLPKGWTPDQATSTLAALEAAHPEVQSALQDLHDQQQHVEQRASAYRVQDLATQLGMPAATVATEVRAALSANPSASDAEIAQTVRAQASQSNGSSGTSSGGSAGGSTGGSSPGGAPAGGTTAQQSPTPSGSVAPSSAPSASPSTAVSTTPSGSPSPMASAAPSATPSGAPSTPAESPSPSAGSATAAPSPSQGASTGTPAPTAAPTVAPTPTPEPVYTPAPTPAPADTPAPTPAATNTPGVQSVPTPTPAPTERPAATPTPWWPPHATPTPWWTPAPHATETPWWAPTPHATPTPATHPTPHSSNAGGNGNADTNNGRDAKKGANS